MKIYHLSLLLLLSTPGLCAMQQVRKLLTSAGEIVQPQSCFLEAYAQKSFKTTIIRLEAQKPLEDMSHGKVKELHGAYQAFLNLSDNHSSEFPTYCAKAQAVATRLGTLDERVSLKAAIEQTADLSDIERYPQLIDLFVALRDTYQTDSETHEQFNHKIDDLCWCARRTVLQNEIDKAVERKDPKTIKQCYNDMSATYQSQAMKAKCKQHYKECLKLMPAVVQRLKLEKELQKAHENTQVNACDYYGKLASITRPLAMLSPANSQERSTYYNQTISLLRQQHGVAPAHLQPRIMQSLNDLQRNPIK